MRDLPERVHARIGAARAGDLHGVTAERRDRLGQHALHARADALHLPADEWRAVILDGELVAGHRLAKFVEGRRIADLAAFRRAFVEA